MCRTFLQFTCRHTIGLFPKKINKYFYYRCINHCHSMNNAINTGVRQTVDENEIKKFSEMAKSWWDKDGVCKPLHSMNYLRVPLIRDGLIHAGVTNSDHVTGPTPLQGVRILDVGCGGGILCEPLARLGAQVTGIDASEQNINVAKLHAERHPRLQANISYIHGSVEEHAEGASDAYDAVVVSEVIEHVADPQFFIDTCSTLVKSKGSFFVTTINRTEASWLGAIVAAQYILKLLPPGTHEWHKFVHIDELKSMLESNLFSVRLTHGMFYLPVVNSWSWTSNKSVNYALHAVKDT